MSVSLRQCIITCLPKGNKPRQNLKNWRPISLLSVIYKIGSTAIANRIKKHLDKIISSNQSGFITGRYIGDITRLIYDIMYLTEKNKVPGLLMFVDFEKAFDSVSWKFLYSTLQVFGFGNSILQWIKTFNKNIKATVIQCGVMSKFINIEKGCRQGDPIASYLFLLCAEVLLVMIKYNTRLKGIKLGNFEYKISQFADDTTLLLDGSRTSLLAALNTLEIFGTMSGLKVNTDKTKLIWIGKKRFARDKIDTVESLNWGQTRFDLLGITFSVNLDEIPIINYEKAIAKSENILKTWSKRSLTPFGKVTVVKSLMLPLMNHLFISLPNPSEHLINQLDHMIDRFIWDNKPCKVKKKRLIKGYLEGGLKMIDICTFIKSLKITWIRRLTSNCTAPWYNLTQDIIGSIYKLIVFGSDWSLKNAQKIKNDFWKDVLYSWSHLVCKWGVSPLCKSKLQ